MSKVGGYIIVDIGPGPINIQTGSSVSVTVSKETVNALRQWVKPVMFERINMTIDGAAAEVSGFSLHYLTSGIHKHSCGLVFISVISDTQITIAAT